jgi:hypothetical protein
MADAAAMRANERLRFHSESDFECALNMSEQLPRLLLSVHVPFFVFRAGRNQLLSERHEPVLERHARKRRPHLLPFHQRSGPGRTRREWRVSGDIAAIDDLTRAF